VEVAAGDGAKVQLAGTVPMLETKALVAELAAGIAAPRQVDVSRVQIADPYITYTIREGDTPETIARRICGSGRRFAAIRDFSRQNAEVLDRMQIGSVLRIPARLLSKKYQGRK
jgi:nucleoid-associated protein YgaU